jgi:hypothetical protein
MAIEYSGIPGQGKPCVHELFEPHLSDVQLPPPEAQNWSRFWAIPHAKAENAMLDNDLLRSIIVGLGTGAIIWMIAQLTARAKPKTEEGQFGRIAPNRVLTIGMILLLSVISSVALWAAFNDPKALVPAGAIGTFFLFFAAVSSTSLFPMYDVEWDENGVTGPMNLWFPPFGPKRGKILWEHIENCGKDNMGSWFIQGKSGQRIRWNWIYSGFPALMIRVEKECPWLFEGPPPDDAGQR